MNEEELIPLRTDSYDSLTFVHTKCACVYKKVGYTPLQVVKDISKFLMPEEISKCTYVGRLDPMAEGWMHVLWNGDMDEKARLASSDKIYEVEIVCGISTDTGDALGLITDNKFEDIDQNNVSEIVQSFIGPFTYPYPKYSSPNIKQTLRGNEGGEKKQKGNIEKIDLIHIGYVGSMELEEMIEKKLGLSKMDGDFRLEEIQNAWKIFFKEKQGKFSNIRIVVHCGTGTYMRTLAEEVGKKLGCPAFALSIKRIGIKHCHTDNK